MIASQRKMDEFRKFGFQFWRQLGRIFLILLAGYLLHMPYLSLDKMIERQSTSEVITFLKVDVLQCIAVSLLYLFVLRLAIKSDKIFNSALALSFAAILILSPLFWMIDFNNFMPLFFANYFNTIHGSLFPLFPWAGFMIAGALCGTLFIKARESTNEMVLIKYGLIFSGILTLITVILLTPGVLPALKPNPVFFFLRISLILLLLIFFWYYEYYRKTEKSFVLDISRESLLVYWLHLQIIYRKFLNGESVNSLVNMSMNVWQVILASILLTILMYAAAKLWGSIKTKYPLPSRILVICASAVVIMIYIFN